MLLTRVHIRLWIAIKTRHQDPATRNSTSWLALQHLARTVAEVSGLDCLYALRLCLRQFRCRRCRKSFHVVDDSRVVHAQSEQLPATEVQLWIVRRCVMPWYLLAARPSGSFTCRSEFPKQKDPGLGTRLRALQLLLNASRGGEGHFSCRFSSPVTRKGPTHILDSRPPSMLETPTLTSLKRDKKWFMVHCCHLC